VTLLAPLCFNLMKKKVTSACLILAFALALATTAFAQDMEIDTKYKSADTNNAVIEGRVTLPSGFAANRIVKITLKNSLSVLSTLQSDKQGEFRFDNLSEGVYFVQAEDESAEFEPVVEKVMLGRGIVWELTVQLRERKIPRVINSGPRVISVAELHQSVPTGAKKEYELGLKLVGKGQITEAAEHFEKAISIYPEYLAARNDLGAQYLKLKRLDDAEKSFHIVLEGDPKNFNAQFNLGLVRVERKNYLDAISQLNQAIAIDSARPAARLWLGIALLETGDLAGAERELTKALVMGGVECVAAHYHLARIYMCRGDIASASRAIRIYLEESPKGEYAQEARQLEKQIKAQP
jgi:Tfp pilus assembly protein PilF